MSKPKRLYDSEIALAIARGEHDRELHDINTAATRRAQALLTSKNSPQGIEDELTELESLVDTLVIPRATELEKMERNRDAIILHGRLEKAKHRIDSLPESRNRGLLDEKLLRITATLLREVFGIEVPEVPSDQQ